MRVSQLVKVRALALTLGLVLVPSLVVLAAPPASAASDVGAPLRYPGSAYGSGVTGTDLNRWHQTNPTKLPTPTGTTDNLTNKVGIKPGGIGAAGAVIGAAYIGLDWGTGAAQILGLPTSGDFFCDLAMVAVNSGCGGNLAAVEGYVPNSDLGALMSPGWAGLNYYVATPKVGSGSHVKERSVTFEVVSAPEYGAESGDAFVRVAFNGECGSNLGSISAGFQIRGYNSKGDVVNRQYKTVSWNGSCETASGGDLMLSIAAGSGYFFDSLLATFVHPTYEQPQGGNVAFWYPEGHGNRPPDQSPDPSRRWRTDWLCSSGNPGTSTSSSFNESSPEWPGLPTAQCAPGAVPTKITWWQMTEGKDDTMLFEWELPGNAEDFSTSNPDCAGGGCQLLLERIDQVTGKQYSCFANPSMCVDWFEDPAKEDNYRCSYGGKKVSLKECNAYRVTFNVGTEGELSDPDPENPDPKPPVNPEPPADPDAPQQDNACPPPFTWTSLMNPWWYYKGMTCALQAAFVPSTSGLQASVGKVRTAWASTSPAKWAVAIGGTFDGVAVQEAGCAGPRLKWDYAQLDFYPFSACEEPMRTWAGWVKGFLSAAVVFTGAFAAFRAVGSGLGWKPSAGGDS